MAGDRPQKIRRLVDALLALVVLGVAAAIFYDRSDGAARAVALAGVGLVLAGLAFWRLWQWRADKRTFALRYVLLVRHAKKASNPHLPDSDRLLDWTGVKAANDVAKALDEQLGFLVTSETGAIRLGWLWHGTFRHTEQTAEIFQAILPKQDPPITVVRETWLDPEEFWPPRLRRRDDGFWLSWLRRLGLVRGSSEPHTVLATCLLQGNLLCLEAEPAQGDRGANTPAQGSGSEAAQEPPRPNAILIVGHQPQLGWIAEELGCRGLPIASSELVCLELKKRFLAWRRARLLWTIAPTDDATLASLRDKIKSKMEVAKVLGAVLVAILALILGTLLDPTKTKELKNLGDVQKYCAYAAGGVYLLGAALYLATVYAYDRLLMPSRFWAESAREANPAWLVRRPPSSEAYVLYQNMTRVWNWLFMPATFALVLGPLLLGAALLPKQDWRPGLYVVGAGSAVFAFLYWWARPSLGAQD